MSKRFAATILFLALLLSHTSLWAENNQRELVLVTSSEIVMEPLNKTALRRLFLGLKDKPLEYVTAVGNRSDRLLYEVFLQKVVYMSARSYERHLLTKVFRLGAQRMPIAEEDEQVAQILRSTPGAISYMWADHARSRNDVVIVQSIWHGSVD